jgi:dolichol-phosphate mannosyltransferase
MDVIERFGKANRYCIFVFVINEGAKVGKQLAVMAQFADRIDICVADGGSTDGSLDEPVLEAGQVRTLLIKRGVGRLSAQMRMAFAYALDQGYDGVVVVDGNGKDDVSAIPLFLAALAEGFDHIQGSRFIRGGRAVNTPHRSSVLRPVAGTPIRPTAFGLTVPVSWQTNDSRSSAMSSTVTNFTTTWP